MGIPTPTPTSSVCSTTHNNMDTLTHTQQLARKAIIMFMELYDLNGRKGAYMKLNIGDDDDYKMFEMYKGKEFHGDLDGHINFIVDDVFTLTPIKTASVDDIMNLYLSCDIDTKHIAIHGDGLTIVYM